jgi:ATP-dependent Clp protease ATP-binding subunit ClpA
MFERFTTGAREAVQRARAERQALGHRFIGTEHLLLGLLDEGAGGAYAVLHRNGLHRDGVRAEVRRLSSSAPLGEADAEALRTIGIDLDEVRARVEEEFGEGALQAPSPQRQGGGDFSRRAKKVLELSLREAIHLKHRSIGPEHLLLGMLREGEGLALKIMHDAGLRLDDLRAQVLAELRAA